MELPIAICRDPRGRADRRDQSGSEFRARGAHGGCGLPIRRHRGGAGHGSGRIDLCRSRAAWPAGRAGRRAVALSRPQDRRRGVFDLSGHPALAGRRRPHRGRRRRARPHRQPAQVVRARPGDATEQSQDRHGVRQHLHRPAAGGSTSMAGGDRAAFDLCDRGRVVRDRGGGVFCPSALAAAIFDRNGGSIGRRAPSWDCWR